MKRTRLERVAAITQKRPPDLRIVVERRDIDDQPTFGDVVRILADLLDTPRATGEARKR